MLRLILKVLINAAALWIAASFVGATIPVDSLNAGAVEYFNLIAIAIIFGFLNALVRPILNILTCPAYLLTLGLFTFVMNMVILWILQGAGTLLLGDGVIDLGWLAKHVPCRHHRHNCQFHPESRAGHEGLIAGDSIPHAFSLPSRCRHSPRQQAIQ